MASPHLTSPGRAALPGKLRAVCWSWPFPNPAPARILECPVPLACPKEQQSLCSNRQFYICPASAEQHLLFSRKRAPVLREGSSLQPPAHLGDGDAALLAGMGAGQGEDLTQNHRGTDFQQPLLTWSRIRAAQQETGKFSPSGSCSKGDSRPGDELGSFAVPVAQQEFMSSSQSTLNLWMALGWAAHWGGDSNMPGRPLGKRDGEREMNEKQCLSLKFKCLWLF